MGTFLGGSAPAMANQVCAGYTLLSPTILKRLSAEQMRSLEFEIDKRLRETRADQIDLQDMDAIRDRNRRLSRIEGALRVLRHSMQQKKMGRL
jgi:hypothetical protein